MPAALFLYPIHLWPLIHCFLQPFLPISGMLLLKNLNLNCYQMPLLLKSQSILRPPGALPQAKLLNCRRRMVVKACQEQENNSQRRGFLSLEEAGLVEISGLSTHERFLCRLTISSLNLLRVISEQEGVPIEELNAGRVCDWFLKDKLKREQDLGSAVLQWDDSEFQL